ncbi:MAG: acetyl/propionyl-CoA carboxylase subunit alpha, partial [Azorhizobium sp. 12-66-6]
MNTRLQVEHPVTELVTGIDLVEQMIRVAAGEPLAFSQADVKLTGWAVESRIYAEDPYRSFLPSTGRLVRYRPPAEGTFGAITVRNDTGVYEGGEISLFYDPMIAKLVTHAPTRMEAILAQGDALDAFAIDGIGHNIPFLSALMAHPRWQSGNLSTGFIAEEYPEGFHPRAPEGETAHTLSAVAATIDHVQNARKRQISGQISGKPVTFDRRRVVQLDGEGGPQFQSAEIDVIPGGFRVELLTWGGQITNTYTLMTDWKPGDLVWTGTVFDDTVSVQVRAIPNGVALAHRGVAVKARVYTEREAALALLMPEKVSGAGGKELLCPMP